MSNVIYENHYSLLTDLPFKFHIETLNKEGIYAHWHENVEFLHAVYGTCRIQCDSKTITLKKGETAVINPLILHRIDTEETVKYFCLIVKNSFFAENGIKAEKLFFEDLFRDNISEKLLFDIHETFKNDSSSFSKAEKRLAVLSYILHICKHHTTEKSYSKSASRGYSAVLNAVKYINDNFSEKLTLEELSENANYSKFHFARIFKESTGVTVFEHINKIRCENARTLLRDTDKPIFEIGFECGFDSSSYFSKIFKSLYGILPTAYRDLYRKL